MKPLHALLIGLMLICVALVSYDGGKRQARREAVDANLDAGKLVVKTNTRPSAPTGLRVVVDDIAQLQKQNWASLEERRKLSFEAGYWQGRVTLVRYLRTNAVSWPIELSIKIINAETNELKAAWDEFNKE